ncbi:arginine--tRNA ligase [Salipaludibacillus agaradhaerens]|uniref:Arginine--tRNA ligase n=1 Tax=Salipaludibacillus agaradhaerens TaxID=76935 RepID=A0A9Q4G0Q5_SALAG|nr:arginine--tRNA ligase [Salipaludibacillus agaradhaerens]MCR6098746.1 arginine--tRNA ligase [Salipaludibacillus agaradhaerens]MCR6115753.1 arginine--tRNA ligase [Salipaludibacillus agaradhaerens]
MILKQEMTNVIYHALDGKVDADRVYQLIETPKHAHLGDLAFPCFQLASIFRMPPNELATDLAIRLTSPWIERVETAGGYLNIFLKRSYVTSHVINEVNTLLEAYGASRMGEGHVLTIDYSSPNIAKPFSMGHLRSTVIGHSLAQLAEKCGYKTVKINHVGDWGTQFGKLMAAYIKWGEEAQVKANPIHELLALYVRFHEEAEHSPELNDEGRYWFKKLEEGDREAVSLWTWFREESLQAFSTIYETLGITFDSYDGEAFYNDKMDDVVRLLRDKGLLVESDGAEVVPLEGLPPCLIKKRDGTTLYATRDLAAAIYRYHTYEFTKSLYVVGNEQSLHFQQLFKVLKKMGYTWADTMHHISFGMMLTDGKKMSTRKGQVILLEEVMNEAVALALANIEEKNPSLANKDEVAKQVGIGAIVFHDLKHDRRHDIAFSLSEMLKYEGETGPYVQYTHARAASLLEKGCYKGTPEIVKLTDESSWPVIKYLMAFPEVIERAFNQHDPSQIAKFIIDLAQAFNHYYGTVKILADDDEKESRLALVSSIKVVLHEGLRLLGIKAPNNM